MFWDKLGKLLDKTKNKNGNFYAFSWSYYIKCQIICMHHVFLGGAPTSICHFCLSVAHHISGTVNHVIIIRTSICYLSLIQVVFDISIPILGTLIWSCPNSIIGKAKTTNISFNLYGHVIDIK